MTSEIVGKSDTRTEDCPVIVHQTLRNSVLAGKTNPVQIELVSSRIGFGLVPKPGLRRADGAVGIENGGIRRVIEVLDRSWTHAH